MLLSLLLTGLLAAQAPAPLPNRAEAAERARSGQQAEALDAFQRLAAANPRDHEARLWIGRLHVWMGNSDRAEPVYRSIVFEDPSNVEAMIGLGEALANLGRSEEAIEVLHNASRDAEQTPEVLAALGRAHRDAGQLSQSLGYLQQAYALSPTPNNLLSLEQTRLLWSHRVEIRSFFEQFAGLPDARGTDIGVNVRLTDRLRVSARGQLQRKFNETEQRAGLGAEWRVNRDTTLSAHALAGPGNDVLPAADGGLEVDHVSGNTAWALGFRYIDFNGAAVSIVTPGVTWIYSDRVNFGLRYSLVVTDFDNQLSNDTRHSAILRGSYRVRPRVWASLGYARGIENFDVLSPDRIGDFRADTASLEIRIDLPSLTSVIGAYDYQWRRDSVEMGRFTISFAQRF